MTSEAHQRHPTTLKPDWPRLAGPDAIGRGIVIAVGGEVPEPWSASQRVRLPEAGAEGIAETLAVLQHARTNRHRIVVEVDDLPPTQTALQEISLTQLNPSTELPGERLHHLLFANSVDARDPAMPSIHAVDLAVAAGAMPSVEDGPGDVVAPDGTPLWCDGGHLQPFPTDLTDEIGVVPLIHLRSGVLSSIADNSLNESELAPDQSAAVTTRRGAARIVAPAGSGKTRVLTERARHLINNIGIDPSVICLVAYNVRARTEMQNRTADLPGLEIRTLNSLALAICRGTGPFRSASGASVRVIDERTVRNHIRDLVRTPKRAMTDPFAAWIEAFSACRLGLRDPDKVEQEFDGDVPGLAGVLTAYRDRLSQHQEVDFDEQIIGAILILLTDPNARFAARRACGMLLVDEFQDLTPAHLLMIRLLAGPAAEVFGVGDDDQTIYGYAGASPSWLIDFAKWFPGAGSHDLHVNYRCAPEIVEAASNLLSHNRRRIDKAIEPAPGRQSGRVDDQPALMRLAAADPVEVLSAKIMAMVDNGVAPAEIAVLTRVNATLLAPMLSLRAAGLSTTTPIDTGYLGRSGVAAALAWLGISVSGNGGLREIDLLTASRRPPRGLSPMIIEWIAEKSSPEEIRHLASRLRNERDPPKVMAIADDIDLLQGLVDDGADTASVLVAIRDRIGLGGALETRLDASRRSVDRSSHSDDLDALISVARLEPDPTQFPNWLASQLNAPRSFDSHGIRLSTIHRVKGMEWSRVVIFGADNGLFPHRLSSDVEEERRIFHVALTRSIDQTIVVSGPQPSQFLSELDKMAEPAPAQPFEHVPPRRPNTGVSKTARKKPTETAVLSPADSELRDRLRSWRTKTANADSVPAYVVANNNTIDAIAAARPTDNETLLKIPGIGPAKLERHGQAILAIVAAD